MTAKLVSWLLRRHVNAAATSAAAAIPSAAKSASSAAGDAAGLTFAEWKYAFDTQARSAFAPVNDTFALAVAGGALADRIAYAFAGAYQAALR